MKIKLSVIVPMYNSEQYIERCLDSILNLDIPKEIIVVDDGSSDNSYSIVEQYAKRGLVFLHRQENKGVSEARNFGLSKASGSFVAFVDSDDLVIKDEFEKFFSLFKESDACMAMGGVNIEFSSDCVENRRAFADLQSKSLNGEKCFTSLMQTNTFTPLVFCYLFRKSFIDSNGLKFCHRMSEDDLWTSVAMCLANNVLITSCVHYRYCKHSVSITGNNKNSLFRADNHIAVANDLYEFMMCHKLEKQTEVWLCCKILYIVSVAVGIYLEKSYSQFSLDLEMYTNIIRIVTQSEDSYAKRVGLMFAGRIVKDLRKLLDLSK